MPNVWKHKGFRCCSRCSLCSWWFDQFWENLRTPKTLFEGETTRYLRKHAIWDLLWQGTRTATINFNESLNLGEVRRGGAVGGGAPLQRALSTNDCVPYLWVLFWWCFGVVSGVAGGRLSLRLLSASLARRTKENWEEWPHIDYPDRVVSEFRSEKTQERDYLWLWLNL